MTARRLLIIAGITLIVAGMIFGDIFAVFVLHQNASRIASAMMGVTDAVAAKDPAAISAHFTNIGLLLEKIGSSLAAGFVHGASGDLIAAHASLQTYADTKFDYVRSVDVHSHWIGLAMLLIVFGIAFDRLGFTEGRRRLLAWSLVVGSVTFPLGVILQTLDRGIIPQAVAAIGAGLVIIALGAAGLGFARSERD